MKYIVKNCGCNPSCDECYNRCADISDCLLKRVIDKCKEVYGNTDTSNDDKASLARELLIMFEIEEVEE